MIWIVAYVVAGAVVGFLAGLLGIGGGMTLVPILATLFAMQALAPEYTVHLALGTGMASVLFTSSASVREHHRLAAVDWDIVRRIAPGTLLGALSSTLAAGWIAQRTLALAFAVIVFAGATQILVGRKPKAARAMPGTAATFVIAYAIGVVCGLVSAGGAFLTIPFMLFCGVSMHRAIGTAAAIGLPVALVGTIGYVIGGWRIDSLPPATLGFVYAPALVALVVASMLTARWGARKAHALPVVTLKRVFAVLLYLLAARMAFTAW